MSYVPFNVWPAPADGGGGGVTAHADLTGRSSANAHPVSAITGLQDALDEGARVWVLTNLIAGATIEDLLGFVGWAAVAASGYVWDDEGLKYADKDAETITVEDGHAPGDLAAIGGTFNVGTGEGGVGGFQTFSAANTLDIDGPWKSTADDDVTVDASDWVGTLASLPDNATLEQVLDALGALNLAPDLSDFVTDSELSTTLSGYVLDGDSRLTNARYPTSHAGSHRVGGSDALHAPRFRVASPALSATDLTAGSTYDYTLTLAPLFAIVRVATTAVDIRLRAYTGTGYRTADAARSFATPIPAGSGCILDVQVAGEDYQDITPAALGFTAADAFDSVPNGADVYFAMTITDASDFTDDVIPPFGIVWVDLHDGLDGTPVGGGNPTS